MTTTKVNKMAVAKTIFAEVTANAEISHPRKVFIERLVEAGATPRGASAYYQMLRTEASGGKLYKHHLTPKQRDARRAAVEPIARPE